MVSYGKAAALVPRNEDYRAYYASFVLEHGKPTEAVDLWASACHDFPRSWRMLMGWGAALYLTGNLTGAAEKLLDALRLDREAVPVYGLLGQLYELVLEKRQEIQGTFADYVERKPLDALALAYYGRIQYQVAKLNNGADFGPAKVTLQKAVAMNPHLAEARLQLGVIAQDEGRLGDSVMWLKQAVREDTRLAYAHYRLGLAYRKLNRLEESKTEMEIFSKLRADSKESIAHQTRLSYDPR